MTVAAVVLAAGKGQRWDKPGHKLLAELNGKPVVYWSIRSAADANLDELIVVSGSVDIAHLVPEGSTLLHNPDWESGQSSSLRVCVDWAVSKGHEAVVVGLGDMPGVPTEAWVSVAECPAPLVVATFNGERRPPTKISAEFFEYLPTEGDVGARPLLNGGNYNVAEIVCQGNGDDIDTFKDLEKWS
ncbi:MAG: nucleotidyltransferase family protein [Actinomycetota bacterium]|nr:nucleotidyltransferase family protein [Actinomycetota bacterium]|tara:strand:- start:6073 stop:6630 length:558 start_codon:yes stop_codon:yes gene_type:complete